MYLGFTYTIFTSLQHNKMYYTSYTFLFTFYKLKWIFLQFNFLCKFTIKKVILIIEKYYFSLI